MDVQYKNTQKKDIRWILIVMKVKQQGQVVIRISLE